MSLPMVPLEIVGLRTDLQAAVRTLQRLGCVQIDDWNGSEATSIRRLTIDRDTLRTQEELRSVAARVEGLLHTLGDDHTRATVCQPVDPLADASAGLAELAPQVKSLISRREELQAELDSLPRYEATLRKFLPIIPPLASEPGSVSVGVLVNRANASVLGLISKHVIELTGGRAETMDGDVDPSTRAMLLVFPGEFTNDIEALLGREDVSRLRLPTELGDGPPDAALAALRRRTSEIPDEINALDRELAGLATRWCGKLIVWRSALRDELEAINVLSRFGETEMTFVVAGWVPGPDAEKVESALREAIGETAFIRQPPITPEQQKRAPVLLQNPSPARPFESLVRLLSLPRYGDIDPTSLMAVFMPMFFGMMLGDVGYGVLLLAICLGLRPRFKPGIMRDLLVVLAIGSGWTILFGFLFGEAFGTLGEHLGMHAIWFDRASPEHTAGLLLMALAVGSVHITLGLILGVWEAIKQKSRGHLLERGGMLLGLMGLFLLTSVLADLMPDGFMTPAVGALIIGVVLMAASFGWLGILMGPVEFIGLIGNILSYLRIAAIGLASVYLAQVANQMAGKLGNLVLGALVAVLIHALNLVMGAFSPTIHSLRLHYVEFFRKFYQGGGRPYEPFKSQF
jgi:V/A-type H+-transporting ATPase subunit I